MLVGFWWQSDRSCHFRIWPPPSCVFAPFDPQMSLLCITILIRKAQLCPCVCVYTERSAACPGTPAGRARRARPKGVSRRGYCGRRPPGGAGGRGVTFPKKNFTKNFFFAKNSPEGAIAAAGRQGVLEGGGRRGGHPPQPQTSFHQKKLLRHKIPRRGHCGCRPPGGAKGGKERGGRFSPLSKRRGAKRHTTI